MIRIWRRRIICACIAATTLGLGSAAWGQGMPPAATPKEPPVKGFISVGAGLMPDYLGGTNYTPVPYIDFRLNQGNYYIRFEGGDARLNLIDSSSFHAGPLLGFRPGRGDVENRQVSALAHVKDSLTGGAFVEWSHVHQDPRSAERLTLLADDDMTGQYTGWTVTARGVVRRPLEFIDPGFLAALEADASWGSAADMRHYFDVSPLGAIRSGLPVYGASEGMQSVGAALALDQFLSRKWSVGLRFHYARLLNSAADSPITRIDGSPDQYFAGVVVGYVL